jgi:histidine ammonia-lyase
VARDGARAELAPEAIERVRRARALVDRQVAGQDAVYGVNTGFGALKKVRIPAGDLAQLQVNLIRSHSVGVGPLLGIDETRALMLLRANAMATGRSGVRVETLSLLVDMLNGGIHPLIPSKGSVGASGDLAPLAHLALAMIGEGDVVMDGVTMKSARALELRGLAPVVLAPKEGLCLVNGTQGMAALGALALLDAEELIVAADLAGAASLEGKRGTVTAFDPRIQAARPHPGQERCAKNLRALLGDSEIAASHADCDTVQDAYSFRCMPQVHGSVRDVVSFVRTTLSRELNAGTDNPLVFAEPGEGDALLSGGNFHGQPLAFALDFLAIGLTTLAGISDRRVEQLIDPALSGLPAFLVRGSGLNSGFMMAQVTAASLVNECRVLSTPASVDSIPTSANQEDHVSMGMTSARKAAEVVKNTRLCLAIEVLAACQAIDLVGLRPGKGVGAVHRAVRKEVPMLEQDRVLFRDVEAVDRMIAGATLRKTAEAVVGPLT